MSDDNKLQVGSIGWMDLTVENADAVRDFYAKVVGFQVSGVEMGGYQDYCLEPPPGGAPVAGVCHARGSNAELPPVWLPYFTVANLEASLREVEARGGKQVSPVRKGGGGAFCVIKDPAGAACALFQRTS
ncbi:MAG: VOC family protein [Myxococcaceae bacterium]|nr:VOC family protein [Myxococcaceae bacterium]MCI0673702.1 VOC family protein [Myxococcaceae bacterium]